MFHSPDRDRFLEKTREQRRSRWLIVSSQFVLSYGLQEIRNACTNTVHRPRRFWRVCRRDQDDQFIETEEEKAGHSANARKNSVRHSRWNQFEKCERRSKSRLFAYLPQGNNRKDAANHANIVKTMINSGNPILPIQRSLLVVSFDSNSPFAAAFREREKEHQATCAIGTIQAIPTRVKACFLADLPHEDHNGGR